MHHLQTILEQIDSQDLWQKNIHLKRDEFLKVGGSKDTNLYQVLSGCLRIFVREEREEHTIRFGYQGDLIAALDSFITEQPSDLFIQAIRKTELKMVDKSAYMKMINDSAELNSIWQELLGHLIFQQMERERDLLTSSPEERFKRVLERSPQLFQEVPRKYIASYLRMTPETLSRIENP